MEDFYLVYIRSVLKVSTKLYVFHLFMTTDFQIWTTVDMLSVAAFTMCILSNNCFTGMLQGEEGGCFFFVVYLLWQWHPNLKAALRQHMCTNKMIDLLRWMTRQNNGNMHHYINPTATCKSKADITTSQQLGKKQVEHTSQPVYSLARKKYWEPWGTFWHGQGRASEHWWPEGMRSAGRKKPLFHPLRLGRISVQPHQHWSILWGWEGSLYNHTNIVPSFEVGEDLCTTTPTLVHPLRLGRISVQPHQHWSILWGWGGPLYNHTNTGPVWRLARIWLQPHQHWSSLEAGKDLCTTTPTLVQFGGWQGSDYSHTNTGPVWRLAIISVQPHQHWSSLEG